MRGHNEALSLHTKAKGISMKDLTKQQVVRETLAQGHSISVWDGEEWQVKKSQDYQEVMDAIESVDVAEIRVRDKDGNVCGWAQIVNGLEADEEVADYSGAHMYGLFEEA
jgi:hypothetical protein